MEDHESGGPCLSRMKEDLFKTYCNVSLQDIKTEQGGRVKNKQHEQTVKHMNALSNSKLFILLILTSNFVQKDLKLCSWTPKLLQNSYKNGEQMKNQGKN